MKQRIQEIGYVRLLIGLGTFAVVGCSESDHQPNLAPVKQQGENQNGHNSYSHTSVRGNSEMIRGSGNVQKESRELEDFTAIEVSMGADVKIVQASEPSVVVIADDNLLPIMSTEVSGDTLQLSARQSFATNSKVTFLVSVPVIRRIVVKGSGGMFIQNATKDSLQLTIDGSGDVGGRGTVNTFQANINGSGKLLLERLQSQDCTVTINGSGKASVYASRSLTATINGSGEVNYFGNPPQVQRRVNGSGEITQVETLPAEKE